MAGWGEREEENRTPEENIRKHNSGLLKERNVTWNEASKKLRHKKKGVKFVHQ